MSLLQERIAERVARHGSYRAAAAVLKVDASYLWRLACNKKTEPSDALLKKLRLRKVVSYVNRTATNQGDNP